MAIGVASLAVARRDLATTPHGDGRAVMLLPGLFNSDRSNVFLRRYLRQIGYDANGWGLGRNFGARTIGAEGEILFAAIEATAATAGPVTLIGVSLGGVMARLASHRIPGAVREVITIASPYAGDPRATNVWRIFEWLTGERIDSDGVIARRAEIAAPLPVPATAIWSASDGIVNGLICHAPDEAGCRAIEVRASHMGVQHRPQVLRAVAEVLAGTQDFRHSREGGNP
ncbi:GPI inositol-deacylase [Sphingomonas sp. SUN019]|uniref:GPI inositol-deacylase n=1 Tax=Sphingomonas sp. SUN019 TaxID=2937788 RepID=UPI0021642B09|nr:GPI inositol-deacylase [Sphingomonas sp. SUN019]UVO51960.1 GPI inositol-deacylase [Sphingomonas sp. SUN019]